MNNCQINVNGIQTNVNSKKYAFSGKEFGFNSDKITLRGNPSHFNRNDLRQIVKKLDESDTVLRKKLYATLNNSSQHQQYKGMGGPKRIDLTFTP